VIDPRITRRHLILHAATATVVLALPSRRAAAAASDSAPAPDVILGADAAQREDIEASTAEDAPPSAVHHRSVSGLVRPGLDPFAGCAGRDPW